MSEYFRRGTERISYCATHSGVAGQPETPRNGTFDLPALDAVPIRSSAPALLGDDPYHTELPNFASASSGTGLVRRSTNVLDSLDLGDVEESIPLNRPQRLEIFDE